MKRWVEEVLVVRVRKHVERQNPLEPVDKVGLTRAVATAEEVQDTGLCRDPLGVILSVRSEEELALGKHEQRFNDGS